MKLVVDYMKLDFDKAKRKLETAEKRAKDLGAEEKKQFLLKYICIYFNNKKVKKIFFTFFVYIMIHPQKPALLFPKVIVVSSTC